MTTEEITTALEQTILKNYENTLVQLGRMLAVNDDFSDRAVLLKRSIKELKTSNKKLTSRNKKLTTQLARAKEDLQNYQKHILYQSNVIERAREISPQVCTLINDIKKEEFARIKTNK